MRVPSPPPPDRHQPPHHNTPKHHPPAGPPAAINWPVVGAVTVAVLACTAGGVLFLKYRQPRTPDPGLQAAGPAVPVSPVELIPPPKAGGPSPGAAGSDPDPERRVEAAIPGEGEDPDVPDRVLGHGLKLDGDTTLPVRNAEPPPPDPPPFEPTRPAPKPAPPPAEVKRSPAPAPAPPGPSAADVAFEKRLQATEEELRAQLEQVPELRLVSDEKIQAFRQMESASDRAPRPRAVQRSSIDYLFNVRLHEYLRQQGGRAGLPLRAGPNCQLDLVSAKVTEELSKQLRTMGFVSVPGVASRVVFGRARAKNIPGVAIGGAGAPEKIEAFKQWCDAQNIARYRGALATLLQMLQVEGEPTRLLLVRELGKVKNKSTTAVLVSRAMMDLSPEVRKSAVEALRKRPAAQYQPLLLAGLRYPWAPVADHAAEALVALGAKSAVPKLVEMLDKPDPTLPVANAARGGPVVRELVRLNHMRNCVLCHAPSAGPKDGLVRGAVPTPGKALPPAYYASRSSGDFVRADITFLKQDFSVNLVVKDPGPWPPEQRFDFVTRLRPVKPKGPPKDVAVNYPQRESVLYTLRKLTGKDGGDVSRNWRRLLDLPVKPASGAGKETIITGRGAPDGDLARDKPAMAGYMAGRKKGGGPAQDVARGKPASAEDVARVRAAPPKDAPRDTTIPARGKGR